MKTRLYEQEIEQLLSDVGVRLGFCLPAPITKRIINNPPTDIGRFANVIYRAEGLDPSSKSPLYYQLHEIVAEAFKRHVQ